jgi:hypothetical protein
VGLTGKGLTLNAIIKRIGAAKLQVTIAKMKRILKEYIPHF